MNRNETIWQERALTGTMLALIGFIVLTTAAMFLYTGGSEFVSTSTSYAFTQNFFSDLGKTVWYHGEANLLVMILFMSALFLMGIGLIAFAAAAPYLFRETAVTHKLACIGSFFTIVSGLGYIGVAVTPSNLYLPAHQLSVLIAFGGFTVMTFFYAAAILHLPSYPNIYAYAYVLFGLSLLFYILYMLYGPDFNSEEGAGLQVIAQKIAVYFSIFSTLFQVYGAKKRAAER